MPWRPSRTLLVIAGVCAAVVALCESARSGLCENDVLAEARSPDGRRRLVVFQRDCGATTGFSTQVSLLDADEALGNDGGNVFVADTDHGLAPAGPGGGPEVRVRWESAARVSVAHHPAARVFEAKRIVDQIQFEYTKQAFAAQQ